MADFTLSQISDTSGGGGSPTSGVAQPSGAQAALGVAGNLFRTFAQGSQARQAEAQAEAEAERKAFENQAASRFSRQQLAIADAVDRGELTSQEGRMRMRANYSRAIADDPSLTELFSDAHKQIVGTAGLGKVAAEGTQQEQAFFKVMDDAMATGWVSPTMNERSAWAATMAFQEFQREQEKIEALRNQINLQRAQVGLQTDIIQQGTARISQENARLNLQQARTEAQARQALTSMASAWQVRVLEKANALQEQFEAGDITQLEMVEQLDNEALLLQSQIAPLAAQSGGTYAAALSAPIMEILNVKRGYATGETPAATMQAITDNAIAKQTMMLTANPDTARIVATSKLVGEAGSIALSAPLSQIALNSVEKNSDGSRRPADLTDPSSTQSSEEYLRVLKDNMDKSNSDSLLDPEGTGAEIQTNINQVLKGMGTYGQMVDNPSDLNQMVDFLASDSYGQYVQKSGTGINADTQAQAREVMLANYDQVVRPLISQEWANATQTVSTLPTSPILGTTGEEGQTADLIQPVFSGNGMRFTQAAGTGNNARIRGRVDELNRKVAPIINRLIKAGAHLEGHRNYEQVYNNNYSALFGAGGEDNAE